MTKQLTFEEAKDKAISFLKPILEEANKISPLRFYKKSNGEICFSDSRSSTTFTMAFGLTKLFTDTAIEKPEIPPANEVLGRAISEAGIEFTKEN